MEVVYVVGAGGIGCVIGYSLLATGLPVTFVESDKAKVAWGRVHGIQVDRKTPLKGVFTQFDDWQPINGATVFLCTKCYNNDAVLDRLPDSTNLIPVQNGFDPAIEAHGHTLEGIASFISECEPLQTRTRITRRGRLHVGFREYRADADLEIVNLLANCRLFRFTFVPEVMPFKYSKLMYNAAIGPLAAAAGLDNGQLLAIPRARGLFFSLLCENYEILKTAGTRLGKIGPFHPDTVSKILRRKRLANALAWAFYPTLRKTYCSMSQDLPNGLTEIDFYNGRLIELAGDRPCPINRGVYALIKKMEQERLPPRLQAIESLIGSLQRSS